MAKDQYWGVYETGVAATPKGPKKFVEEMAGMLSKPDGTGRKVCLQRGPKDAALGEAAGICYVGGVRQKTRRPRPKKPIVPTATTAPETPPKASE